MIKHRNMEIMKHLGRSMFQEQEPRYDAQYAEKIGFVLRKPCHECIPADSLAKTSSVRHASQVRSVFLELNTGQAQPARFGDQPGQAVSGIFQSKAAWPDIRDAVAIRIPSDASTRRECQVDADGVRRAEAGTFADQDDAELGAQCIGDVIA